MPKITGIAPELPRVNVELDLHEVQDVVDLLHFAEVWLRERSGSADVVGPRDVPPFNYLAPCEQLRAQLAEWLIDQPPF